MPELYRNNRWLIPAAWLVLLAGLAVAFGPNFVEMWNRWFPAWHRADMSFYAKITKGESYYTHGPLIPLVSVIACWVILRKHPILRQPRPAIGLTVMILFLLIHWISCLARVNFASGFACIGFLAGLILFVWGSQALQKVWFPLAFLAFMVPLPEVSISQMNFRLKMIAVDGGVAIANLIGILCEQSGNKVFLQGDKSLVVANVCNGLRTLISVMAFGAMYAYICRLRGVWKLILFFLSVPIALISNMVRIVSLILVADFWSTEIATGWFHDFSGLMILVLAYFLYFGTEKLIFKIHALLGRPLEPAPLWKPRSGEVKMPSSFLPMAQAIASRQGMMAIGVTLLLAAGTVWLNRSAPAIYNENTLSGILPPQADVGGRTWQSYTMDIDSTSLLILETEEAMLRRYIRPGESLVDFCIVFSKDNRKGTHPPDVCLEGGGSEILLNSEVVITGIPGRESLRCRELVVQDALAKTYYLYTYKCGNRYTNSFWLQQGIIFANGLLHRNASGALIRISTPIEGEIDPARRRAVSFLRMGIPYLDQSLP